MKKTILSIALLITLTGSLSSCLVNRDPYGRSSDRGKSFPHDEHKDDKDKDKPKDKGKDKNKDDH